MQKDVTISWSTFEHGGKSDIYTIAQQLTAESVLCERGVTLKASDSNSGLIYIGDSEEVTVSDGYELGAGDSVFLAVNNVNKIYVISNTDNQAISWLSV